MKQTFLWFDGACEPVNPGGLATFGFLVREDDPPVKGRFVHSGSGVIGRGRSMTNNLAEYHALGRGMRWLVDNGRTADPLVVRGDSKLVVCQMTGEWECRALNLIPLLARCQVLFAQFARREIRWVPRDENAGADELTRAAYESATGESFPQRPTRRRALPGQTR